MTLEIICFTFLIAVTVARLWKVRRQNAKSQARLEAIHASAKPMAKMQRDVASHFGFDRG
jgi:hypothetical protein